MLSKLHDTTITAFVLTAVPALLLPTPALLLLLRLLLHFHRQVDSNRVRPSREHKLRDPIGECGGPGAGGSTPAAGTRGAEAAGGAGAAMAAAAAAAAGAHADLDPVRRAQLFGVSIRCV